MGGMAAQIPIKNDAEANERALGNIRDDKEREAQAGHDGTWIAHPGLAAVALKAFNDVMPEPNQIHNLREDTDITCDDLLKVPYGDITESGVRSNIRVGIQYVEAWLGGNGCVPLYNLMEDMATAEISRAQLWQWIHYQAQLNDGREINVNLFDEWCEEELQVIKFEIGEKRFVDGKFDEASSLFSIMIKRDEFDEFLTLPAYDYLN